MRNKGTTLAKWIGAGLLVFASACHSAIVEVSAALEVIDNPDFFGANTFPDELPKGTTGTFVIRYDQASLAEGTYSNTMTTTGQGSVLFSTGQSMNGAFDVTYTDDTQGLVSYGSGVTGTITTVDKIYFGSSAGTMLEGPLPSGYQGGGLGITLTSLDAGLFVAPPPVDYLPKAGDFDYTGGLLTLASEGVGLGGFVWPIYLSASISSVNVTTVPAPPSGLLLLSALGVLFPGFSQRTPQGTATVH